MGRAAQADGRVIHYINLTNGIEALAGLPQNNVHFIRIQSTLCEQHRWDQILQELDYDFLMNAALGNHLIVHDFGAGKPIPRAVYKGVEWIKYVLYRRWLGQAYHTRINRTPCEEPARNCDSYFDSCYRAMEKRTKRKLDYFKPFVAGNINITAVTAQTRHDGDKLYFRSVLDAWQESCHKQTAAQTLAQSCARETLILNETHPDTKKE